MNSCGSKISMYSQLFFAVWDLPELRAIIRSFMWPGRRSATWYKYRDLVAAAQHGYIELILARSHKMYGSWDVAASKLIDSSNVSAVYDLIERRAVNFYGELMRESFREQTAIAAARCGIANIMPMCGDFARTAEVIAMKYGHVDVLQAIHEQCGLSLPNRASIGGHVSIMCYVLANISANTRNGRVFQWINNAVSKGYSHVLDWLEKLDLMKQPKQDSIQACVRGGYHTTVEWLRLRGYKIYMSRELLVHDAISSGSMQMIMWVHKQQNIAEVVSKNSVAILRHAVTCCGLDTIKWLHSMTTEALDNHAIWFAINRGDKDIVKWALGISGADGSMFVVDAIWSGQHKLARWMADRYGIKGECASMLSAISSGDEEMVLWILKNMAPNNGSQALDDAIRFGELRIANIIHERYRCKCRVDSVDTAISRGKIETAEWARQRLGVSYTWATFVAAACFGEPWLLDHVLRFVDRQLSDDSIQTTIESIGCVVGQVNCEGVPEKVRAAAVMAAITWEARSCYDSARYLCVGYKLGCIGELMDKTSSSDIRSWLNSLKSD